MGIEEIRIKIISGLRLITFHNKLTQILRYHAILKHAGQLLQIFFMLFSFRTGHSTNSTITPNMVLLQSYFDISAFIGCSKYEPIDI